MRECENVAPWLVLCLLAGWNVHLGAAQNGG